MSGPLDEEVEALCVDLSLTLCRRVLDYWIIGRRPVQFYCNMQHSGGPSCLQFLNVHLLLCPMQPSSVVGQILSRRVV